MSAIRLRRIRAGRYETPDGLWEVWQEPYPPRAWFVNEKGADATQEASGFPTKWEAVEFLGRHLGKKT